MTPTGTSCTLLDRAASRDGAAWESLVALYGPLVRHWCRRTGVPPEDVSDVVQDVFLSVSLGLPDFHRQRTGSFRRWVRGIARHKSLDHLRRRRRQPAAEGGTEAHDLVQALPADDVDNDPAEEAEEVGGLYRRALDLVRVHFEDRTWRAFWRSTVDNQPTDVVASELALTPVAVRIAKARVLARLRRDVGDLIR